MDADLTAEQRFVRTTLRQLLDAHCGPEEVKAAGRTVTGHDTELWATLAGELGLAGLALPAEHGGVGCPFTDLVLAAEETGRALAPSPLLATSVLVAPLLDRLGTPGQRAAHLPRLAAGELTAALVTPGDLSTALGLVADNNWGWSGDGRAGGIQATQRREPPGTGEATGGPAGGPGRSGNWLLYGEAAQVLDGHSAGLLLVAAHTGGYARSRTRLFLVRADSPGVRRVRLTAMDETRPQARVELREAEGELLGTLEPDGSVEPGSSVGSVESVETGGGADRVTATLARTGVLAAAFLAAEAVGAAQSALERTLEHVGARHQFGRPIGSFQAVKHRLADVHVQIQAARSATYYAAWAAGGSETDEARAVQAAEAAPLALAQSLEALRTAAAEAVQLHGGIGFTWEHAAHLYLKRATGDELLFGPAPLLRDRSAQRHDLFGDAVPSAPVPEPRSARAAREAHPGREVRSGSA